MSALKDYLNGKRQESNMVNVTCQLPASEVGKIDALIKDIPGSRADFVKASITDGLSAEEIESLKKEKEKTVTVGCQLSQTQVDEIRAVAGGGKNDMGRYMRAAIAKGVRALLDTDF